MITIENFNKNMFDSNPPFLLRLINFISRLIHRIGIDMRSFDIKKLVRTARRKTGLNDLGEDDHYTALTVLVNSLKKDVNLNFFGKLMTHHVLLQSLQNRFLLMQELKNHPGSVKIPLKPMLVIVAMPRTGTTLLQRLLAQDPLAISLPLWLLLKPIPSSLLSKYSTKYYIYQGQIRFFLWLIQTLEQYGLTSNDIGDCFLEYTKRFRPSSE